MSDDKQQLSLVPEDLAFSQLVADVRGIIQASQGQVVTTINVEMVATYWRIGERIVQEEQGGAQRAAYGTQLLTRLGRALSVEFGRGFAEVSLQNMRRFYLAYPISSALRRELAWTHYRILMRLDEDRRNFYERAAATHRWSSRELERQINSMLAERVASLRNPEQALGKLPDGMGPLSFEETFRDPYVLDFLGLIDPYSERDLEAALVRHIEKFLLELGSDFYFGGRQRRITIDREDFYIDLVFWHRQLNCQVFIDLKMGRLTHADVSQMKLYINWARRYDKRAGENDPIGLILCGSKNSQVIELLLSDPADSVDQRIKVAQYLLLDSETALKERLAQLSEAWRQARTEATQDDEEELAEEPEDLV